MAIGTIGVIFISIIGSLTFLPATLAILGDRVNTGRIPFFGRSREEGSGIWARMVGGVMRRPVARGRKWDLGADGRRRHAPAGRPRRGGGPVPSGPRDAVAPSSDRDHGF